MWRSSEQFLVSYWREYSKPSISQAHQSYAPSYIPITEKNTYCFILPTHSSNYRESDLILNGNTEKCADFGTI